MRWKKTHKSSHFRYISIIWTVLQALASFYCYSVLFYRSENAILKWSSDYWSERGIWMSLPLSKTGRLEQGELTWVLSQILKGLRISKPLLHTFCFHFFIHHLLLAATSCCFNGIKLDLNLTISCSHISFNYHSAFTCLTFVLWTYSWVTSICHSLVTTTFLYRWKLP